MTLLIINLLLAVFYCQTLPMEAYDKSQEDHNSSSSICLCSLRGPSPAHFNHPIFFRSLLLNFCMSKSITVNGSEVSELFILESSLRLHWTAPWPQMMLHALPWTQAWASSVFPIAFIFPSGLWIEFFLYPIRAGGWAKKYFLRCPRFFCILSNSGKTVARRKAQRLYNGFDLYTRAKPINI